MLTGLEVRVFAVAGKTGVIFSCEDITASTTRIGSPGFVPPPGSQASSVTPRPAASGLNAGGKNGVRRLRDGAPDILRPRDSPGSGPLLRRHTGVPGDPDPPGVVPDVREGEAGAARLPCRQPALHKAVCLLRGTTMPCWEHQGRGPRVSSGLAHGQGAGQAVHGGATGPCWHAGAQGDRNRRGVDPHKGHTYRIVVSDLVRGRPIWFGGEDRSEASMAQFYDGMGEKKAHGIRLAVMDMWKPFRKVTREKAPQAAILFDKFHVMRHLGVALDQVRKSEYARLTGRQRRYIKGQKYTLLSRKET